MRPSLAALPVVLSSALALAPVQEGEAALLELADVLPALRELLDGLGPPPAVADLVAACRAQAGAAAPPAASARVAERERAEREAAALCGDGRFDAALELVRARAARLAAELAPDQWELLDARRRCEELGEIIALDEAAQDELAGAERAAARAEELFEGGRYREALALGTEALDLRMRHLEPRLGPVTAAAEAVASSRVMLGDRAGGLELYRIMLALTLAEVEPSDPAVGRVLLGIAPALEGAGTLPLVEEVNRHALGNLLAACGPDDEHVGFAVLGLAATRERSGHADDAVLLYRRAAEVFRVARGPRAPIVGSVLLSLGHCWVARNELAEAERVVCLALQDHLLALADDDPRLGEGLMMLGVIQSGRGDVHAARATLEQARAVLVRGLDEAHPWIATCTNELARIARDLGAAEESEALLAEARRIWSRALGEEHANLAYVRSSLADVLRERGALAEAEHEAREALRIVEASFGAADPRCAPFRTSLGEVLLARDQRDLAEAELEAAVRLAATPATRAAALAALGRSAWERGELAHAEELLAAALAAARAGRTDAVGGERERALRSAGIGFARIGARLAVVRVLRGDPAGAFAAAEECRARALLDLLARSGAELADELERSAPGAGARLRGSLTERDAARAALDAAVGDDAAAGAASPAASAAAWTRVAAAEASLRAALEPVWPAAEPATLDALARTLAPGECLLTYVWTEEDAVVVCVPSQHDGPALAAPVAASRADVAQLARRLAALDPGLALETLVPSPIAGRVAAARRVVVVPDGPLHGFPFEALVAPDGEPWIERGPEVVYVPSASVLVDRRVRAAGARPAGDGTALVVADPDLGARARAAGAGLASLPGARVEAREVARRLAAAGLEVRLLVGGDATLAALEGAGAPRVLHLATHARGAPADAPYSAFLALAARGNAGEAGDLTLERMIRGWRGRLGGCELVVLSACDSERGAALGDNVVSLPWGFFYAGARSVVASLWKVDDTATALLMTRFHDERAAAETAGRPASPAAALGAAKRWLRGLSREEARARCVELGLDPPHVLRGSGELAPGRAVPAASPDERPFRDPRAWAAFVVIGAGD